MKTVIVHCDRCGVEVRQHRTLLDVASGPLREHRHAIDLCGSCGADLAAWLDAVAPVSDPAFAQPPRVRSPRLVGAGA